MLFGSLCWGVLAVLWECVVGRGSAAGGDEMIWELLGQLAAAFGATVGFAVLVNAPPREFVWAGVTGAVGWGC